MKTFKRPISNEKIADTCEMYKKEMYKHLVDQYQGQLTDEEAIDYIKSLIKEQDDMGFWGFVKPREVDADIRVLYFYEPTYIAISTMMFYKWRYPNKAMQIEGFEQALERGLNAAIGRGFKGSGYDEVRGIAQAMKYFAYGNVEGFIEEYPEAWLHFTLQYREAKKFLSTLLREGKTKNAWGSDFKTDIEETFALLKEVKTYLEEGKDEPWVWVFVYGTLMKGERNHAQYMSEAVFEGDYYLKNYGIYELEGYPGIVRHRNNKVIGELYRIEAKYLESLDQLEGEGVLYKREKVQIKSIEDDTLYTENEVYTYVYLGDIEGKEKIGGKWIGRD